MIATTEPVVIVTQAELTAMISQAGDWPSTAQDSRLVRASTTPSRR